MVCLSVPALSIKTYASSRMFDIELNGGIEGTVDLNDVHMQQESIGMCWYFTVQSITKDPEITKNYETLGSDPEPVSEVNMFIHMVMTSTKCAIMSINFNEDEQDEHSVVEKNLKWSDILPGTPMAKLRDAIVYMRY
jgi:hypothetical protein